MSTSDELNAEFVFIAFEWTASLEARVADWRQCLAGANDPAAQVWVDAKNDVPARYVACVELPDKYAYLEYRITEDDIVVPMNASEFDGLWVDVHRNCQGQVVTPAALRVRASNFDILACDPDAGVTYELNHL
jgi:hypothetical protein